MPNDPRLTLLTKTVKAVPDGKLTLLTHTRTRRLVSLCDKEYSLKPVGAAPLIVAPNSCAKIPPGLALGEGETDGDTLGEIEGEIEGETDGEIEGETDGETLGEPDGETDGDGDVMPKTPAAIVVPPLSSATVLPLVTLGTVCPLSVRISNCPLPNELITSCPIELLLCVTVKAVPAGKFTEKISVLKRRIPLLSTRYSDLPKGATPLIGLPDIEASMRNSSENNSNIAAFDEIIGLTAQIKASKIVGTITHN